MASQTLVLDVQLDVLNQTITYKDYIRVIPESYWTDTLVPYMYPLWDTDRINLSCLVGIPMTLTSQNVGSM